MKVKMFSVLLTLFLAVGLASAQTYAVLDFPGGESTSALGINDAAKIVGRYLKDGAWHGFQYESGVYSDLPMEIARAINKSGDIVGNIGCGGQLLRGGVLIGI